MFYFVTICLIFVQLQKWKESVGFCINSSVNKGDCWSYFLLFSESIYRRGARRWRKLYYANGHAFQAKRFNRVRNITTLPTLFRKADFSDVVDYRFWEIFYIYMCIKSIFLHKKMGMHFFLLLWYCELSFLKYFYLKLYTYRITCSWIR